MMPETGPVENALQSILIVGAGGQAREVISLLLQINDINPRFHIQGIVDTGFQGQHESIMGVPVIGGEQVLRDTLVSNNDAAFVAIGDNRERQHWFEQLQALGYQLPNIISPQAYVDGSAEMGQGNMVGVFAYIGPQCRLGDNNIINTRATFEHESLLGSHSHLAPACNIGGRCVIGSGVLMGLCSVALPATRIPDNSSIGANACVTRSLAQAGTYVGTPAKRLAS